MTNKTFKELLRDNGVTASALANAVGVTRAAAHYWVDGEVLPSGENIVKVAQVLGVTPSRVLESCINSQNARRKQEEGK